MIITDVIKLLKMLIVKSCYNLNLNKVFKKKLNKYFLVVNDNVKRCQLYYKVFT